MIYGSLETEGLGLSASKGPIPSANLLTQPSPKRSRSSNKQKPAKKSKP